MKVELLRVGPFRKKVNSKSSTIKVERLELDLLAQGSTLQIVVSACQVGNPSLSHWHELLYRHDSTLADLKRYANASFHLSLCLRDWSKKNTTTSGKEVLAVGIEQNP